MLNLHQDHPTFAFNPSSHMATQSSLDCSDAHGLVISRLNQSTSHPRGRVGGIQSEQSNQYSRPQNRLDKYEPR